jgi:hypothetical protein
MMTYLLGFLMAGHNQFVTVPIAAQANQIGPWARALASLRGCVAKHPDNPGALPYQRSAAQSERTWIGLGLAAWNGGGTGVGKRQ